MTLPRNKKHKQFSWSLSALQDYEGCPRRSAARRYFCTADFVPSAASIWGDRVHKAAECALKGEKHNDPEAYALVKKYVEVLLSSGMPVEAEPEICLNPELNITGWFAKRAWLRMKTDYIVTALDGKSVQTGDWKTGKRKYDDDQLILTNVVLLLTRPELEWAEGRYIWLKTKKISTPVRTTRDELGEVWGGYMIRVQKMISAWRREAFPARPSGLCPWCPVGDCERRQG